VSRPDHHRPGERELYAVAGAVEKNSEIEHAEQGETLPAAGSPLGALVLTCGSKYCRHTFEPDLDAFTGHRLSCPC
jgi:hypothetical protein